MKRILCAVCLCVALGYSPAFAGFWDGSKLATHWQEYKKFNNGAPYSNQSADVYIGYIIGSVETGDLVYFSIPADAKVNQMCAIVGKWLEDHPEEWNKSATSLTIAALSKAFPLK